VTELAGPGAGHEVRVLVCRALALWSDALLQADKDRSTTLVTPMDMARAMRRDRKQVIGAVADSEAVDPRRECADLATAVRSFPSGPPINRVCFTSHTVRRQPMTMGEGPGLETSVSIRLATVIHLFLLTTALCSGSP
jgi:hypothetical protein